MAKGILKHSTVIEIIDAGNDFPGVVDIPDHVRIGWKIINDEWVEPTRITNFTPEELVLETKKLKESLKDKVTEKRWMVETSGIVLPDGTSIKTGIDDKNRITSVVVNAKIAGLTTIDFKSDSGWIMISLAELEGIASMIAVHTDNCFKAEKAHHVAIDALEYEALLTYNTETGWPSRNF